MTSTRRSWARLASRASSRAAALWIAVYVLVCATGQRFDARYLGYGWQLIPWDVLSTDPVRSVWFLHVQPPLWNLLLGGTAWLSPFGDSITLQAMMALIGIAGVVLAAELTTEFGLSRRWSIVVALIVTLNPEVLKGVFEPTYELVVGVLLMAVVLTMLRLRSGSTPRRAVLVLSTLVTITTMTRSLYHPVWALTLVFFALWMMRRSLGKREVIIALSIPLLVMGGWMAKNQILFGEPTLSSWFGMNLQRAVIPVLPQDELETMHDEGKVSDIAMIGPFGAYGLYADAMPPCAPEYSHRSVSEPGRTTDETSPNFNYQCFLPIFAQAGDDAMAVIREHPEVWVEGRLWSLRAMFSLATGPSESKSVVMRTLDDSFAFVRLDYGGVLSTRGWGTPIYGWFEAPVDFGLGLILVYGAVLLGGLDIVIRRIRRRPLDAIDPGVITAAFTVLFTIVVGVVAELGEQARFRTMTDPLASIVAIVLITRIVRRWRQRQASAVGR